MSHKERLQNVFRKIGARFRFAKVFVLGVFLPILLAVRFLQLPVYDYIGEITALGDGDVEVTGTVVREMIKGNQKRLILSNVVVSGTKIHSALFIILSRGQKVGQWSHITLNGQINLFSEPNIEQFAENVMVASMYYPQVIGINESTGMARVVNQLQQRLTANIRTLLPEPHAALLAGIVFGIGSEMTESFNSVLKSAGLIHIVVASGFNALIVGNFVLRTTIPLQKTVRFVTFSFLMFLYVLVTGFQVPIIRAAIMTAGSVLAQLRGEYKQSFWWLILSAYVLLLYRPQWLFSLSFQLSFAASLGIILCGDGFKRLFVFVPSIVREDTAATFAAQFFTLPLLYLRVGAVSWAGFVTNPLVLWAIVPIMYIGAIAVFLSFISVTLGQIAILPVWFLLDLLVFVTRQVSMYV